MRRSGRSGRNGRSGRSGRNGRSGRSGLGRDSWWSWWWCSLHSCWRPPYECIALHAVSGAGPVAAASTHACCRCYVTQVPCPAVPRTRALPVLQEEEEEVGRRGRLAAAAADEGGSRRGSKRGAPLPDESLDQMVSEAQAGGTCKSARLCRALPLLLPLPPAGRCWRWRLAGAACWEPAAVLRRGGAACLLPLPTTVFVRPSLARDTSINPASPLPAAAELRNMGLFETSSPGVAPAEGGEAAEDRYPAPPQRSYRLPELLRLAGLQEQVRRLLPGCLAVLQRGGGGWAGVPGGCRAPANRPASPTESPPSPPPPPPPPCCPPSSPCAGRVGAGW